MSKFFNETRTGRKTDSVPATANVNIQDLVSSLKEHMESNGAAASHSGQIDLQHLLQPLEESNGVASQVAAVRLENCRSIKLPRTEERSFLVSQYNPAMQAAVEAYRTLRTRLVKQQTRNGARSLVVTSSAQGEGKTLTIFNLAICYAKIENWPVLVVDADLRTRGLSMLAGDPESFIPSQIFYFAIYGCLGCVLGAILPAEIRRYRAAEEKRLPDRISVLRTALFQYFYDIQQFQDWLNSYNSDLGGRRPLDVLGEDSGIQRLTELVTGTKAKILPSALVGQSV